jgi:hypothetical protein
MSNHDGKDFAMAKLKLASDDYSVTLKQLHNLLVNIEQ